MGCKCQNLIRETLDNHSSYFEASWRPETLKNEFPILDYPYLDHSDLEIKQNLKKSPSAVFEIFCWIFASEVSK